MFRYVPYSQTGLEEIFEDDTENLKPNSAMDATEIAEKQRAGSRERSSPVPSRIRSSPTPSRRSYHIKPDPWVCNADPPGGCSSGLCTRPGTPSQGACESSMAPKRLGSPIQKSKVLANRDKESLLDEIINLKKAFLDQSANLQRQKVHATNLETENRCRCP